ncbi:MAG: bacteriohemerythrin [Candidatus Kapaibacteriales bacterium]
MAFIVWKENYAVGINVIDSQHKRLVEIINDLNEALQEGKSKEVLGEILLNFINFVHLHFKTEEEIMVKEDFNEYAIHRYEHEKLTDEMKRFYEDYLEGSAYISAQLMNYFRDWLMDHIMAKDKKLASFLKKKGIN